MTKNNTNIILHSYSFTLINNNKMFLRKATTVYGAPWFYFVSTFIHDFSQKLIEIIVMRKPW